MSMDDSLRDDVAKLDRLVTAQVAGRAGQASLIRQQGDRLESAERSLIQLTATVQDLVVRVDALEVAKATGPKVYDWTTITDADLAEQLMVKLIEWVDGTLKLYNPDLKDCWAWHPAVVQAALNLQALYADALKAGSWDRMNSWLMTARPTLMNQLATTQANGLMQGCDNRTHKWGPHSYAYDTTRRLDYVRWWTRYHLSNTEESPPGLAFKDRS